MKRLERGSWGGKWKFGPTANPRTRVVPDERDVKLLRLKTLWDTIKASKDLDGDEARSQVKAAIDEIVQIEDELGVPADLRFVIGNTELGPTEVKAPAPPQTGWTLGWKNGFAGIYGGDEA